MTSRSAGWESDQEQLDRLRAENQALRAELVRAQELATMGTMAAMVAHEFNNILTPIISYAQLAQHNPAYAEKAIARAADGGHRASTICQAPLGLAADAPRAQEPVKLADLLRDTFDAMARDPHKDLIELVIRVPENLTLTTRRVELQHVLLNLILNARSAVLKRSGGRKLEISAQKRKNAVQIQVSDNGGGIPPELQSKIFDAFFTTKTDAGSGGRGFGLGLAFCGRVLASLNGKISVRSELGKGTTFTVALPAAA